MIHINISKQLQFSSGKKALEVNIHLPQNQITALWGESGAGKTTLLKMIAGLLKPDAGSIEINNAVWFDAKQKRDVPPQQRSIGFVFQDYALFPNMTVLQNLQFAANEKKDEAFIYHLLETTSMQAFLHAKPSRLSGGQQQRVALIRALVRKPKLLLLDEPLSALNTELRYQLHEALQQLQNELGFTAILVSHNKEEVCALSHHLIQLQEGKVIFEGTPQQAFSQSHSYNQLQFMAKVISVKTNDNATLIEIKIGNQIQALFISGDETQNVKAGDEIMIDAADIVITSSITNYKKL